MFSDKITRLLREQWGSITEAMQEVVALFQDGQPLSHRAPLTITNENPESPAFTLTHATDSQYVFAVQDAHGNRLGGLELINGDLVFRSYSRGGNNSTYPTQQDVISQFPRPAEPFDDSGHSYIGQVRSVGASSSFGVRIYPTGTTESYEDITATNLGTSDPEVDDWVTVVRAGSLYYMTFGGTVGDTGEEILPGEMFIGHSPTLVSGSTYNVTAYLNGYPGTGGTTIQATHLTGANLANVSFVYVLKSGDNNYYFIQYERLM